MPAQMSNAARHPVEGFIKNFSQYPEYWQTFMIGLMMQLKNRLSFPMTARLSSTVANKAYSSERSSGVLEKHRA